MKTAGFIISHKENEHRRALLPENVDRIPIECRAYIYIENGYGLDLGYSDSAYSDKGLKICSREDVLLQDILVDPKIGDGEYLAALKPGQTVFGWVHAVQNRPIADNIINNRATAIAWEDMYQGGRHTFWRNNEIAGEAAIMHAYSLHGIFPYETKVALLGNGNVARGAYRILVSLGADVVQYNRRSEQLFQAEMGQYDVIVNAILWDTSRKDHIIYKEDLKRLKKGCLIIDISCDRAGAVETSIPTTILAPTYLVEGVTHYVVDHTPSIFYKTISRALSNIVSERLPLIMRGELSDELKGALCIQDGTILDKRIIEFQGRNS